MIEALLGFCIAGWIVTFLVARWRIKNLRAIVDVQIALLSLNLDLWDFLLGTKKYTDNVIPFRRK